MEYYDMSERWEFPDDGDSRFLYNHVIFRDGDDYFAAQIPERVSHPEDLPKIDPSRLQKIPQEHIWPLFEDKLTICPQPNKPDVYIKQPRLTGYDGTASLSSYLLQEARICEVLMKSPHENVASYLGCVVKDGRITGLCFQKYAETLLERLRDGRSVDIESCLRQVEAGLNHLHALDLVHNDLRLDNVMFAELDSNALAIIDFDSCAVKGSVLPPKRGEMPEGACTAEFKNDEFALEIFREKLCIERQKARKIVIVSEHR